MAMLIILIKVKQRLEDCKDGKRKIQGRKKEY